MLLFGETSVNDCETLCETIAPQMKRAASRTQFRALGAGKTAPAPGLEKV
jgi:hypothetical protein